MNDQAQELCKRTLEQNKSCSQAWEICGLVMEKEGHYDLAADCYQKVPTPTALCPYLTLAETLSE